MTHEADGVAEELEALVQRGGQAALQLARGRALRHAAESRAQALSSTQRAQVLHAVSAAAELGERRRLAARAGQPPIDAVLRAGAARRAPDRPAGRRALGASTERERGR